MPFRVEKRRGGVRGFLVASVALAMAAILAGIGMLVAIFATQATIRAKVPVTLGHRHVVVLTSGNIAAKGTWVWQGAKPAFPIQAVQIFCDHQLMRCVMATASVGSGNMLSADSDEYAIKEWTKNNHVLLSEESFCQTTTYSIDAETETVTGITRRHDEPERADLCKNHEREIRYTLLDGVDVWKMLVNEATPWYAKIAQRAPAFLWRLASLE